MRAPRDIFADALILRGFSVVGVSETEVRLSHPSIDDIHRVEVTDEWFRLVNMMRRWDGGESPDCIAGNIIAGRAESQANGLCDMFGV